MKCLLTIQLFKFTGDEIGQMRKKQPHDRYLDGWLPTYCLKPDNGVIESTGWLQFIDAGKEFFYGFNILRAEGWLDCEIDNLGFETVAKEYGIDLSFLKDICRYGYDDTFHSYPANEHLVFDVSYSTSYTDCGQETDCDIELIGYLNEEKELVKL